MRELHEELGISPTLDELIPLGVFQTTAANEAGFDVVADCFMLQVTDPAMKAAAEIAEARWLTQEDIVGLDIAPLSAQVLLPLLWAQAPVHRA